MDKFTVDLDQVLNDFEYSELTDQYNTVRHPIDTPSSLNHNNVTKHSINNVFHSLNEYLNTNIDIPSVNNIENTIKEVNVLTEVENAVGESLCDDPLTNIHVEDCPDNKYFAESKHYCDLENEESKVNADLGEKFGTTMVENDNNENDKSQLQNGTAEELEQSNNNLTKVHVEVEDLDYKTDNKSIPNEVEQEDTFYEATDETLNKTDDILVQINTSNTVFEDNSSNMEENENLQDEKTHLEENVRENDHVTEENCLQEETVNPIGFKAVTEVYDDEVHKLLAELENDEDLIGEVSQNNDYKQSNNEDDDSQNEDTTHQVEPIIITKTEETPIIVTSHETEIKETDNVREQIKPEEITIDNSTNEKENQIEEISPLLVETVEATVSEDSQEVTVLQDVGQQEHLLEAVCEKPTESKNIKETDVNDLIDKQQGMSEMSQIEQTEGLVEHVELVKEQENQIKMIEEVINDKIEQINQEESKMKTEPIENPCQNINPDPVSRPKHLPLKEIDNEEQREINLIGDPGSTPYNNVYISEEINNHEEGDTVSITSTSSFDSSNSTVSSASTEEIANVNDVSFQNNPISKSTRNAVEQDSRELSEDGDKADVTSDSVKPDEMTVGQATSSGDAPMGPSSGEKQWLGKEAPLWIPDSDTTSCLHCDMKFTVLKRRHHCRACGLVLCSKCCYLRFKLEYLDAEARVCNKCHDILNRDTNSSSGSDVSPDAGNSPLRRPNPNNPLEYCSTISPLQQVSGASSTPVPAVMVPVGVLKRKGSNKAKSNKSVMFCDGIRPGSDLTNLDNDFNYNDTKTKKLEKTSTTASAGKINRNLPLIDFDTNSFIPKNENCLPPLITITKTDISYTDCQNNPAIVEQLKNNELTFAILLSLYVHVKIINMSCCINKTAWCFSTEGLINVGQDEIVIILEYIDEESFVPKDIFYHINNIYSDAVKGTSIKELGLSLHNTSNFLDSKNHAGFVYIRPTFQCLENVIKPKEPFLIGILIHRWETPWAKLFPLRLILRLGAEYRYYPSPVISTRHRDSVFVEIGHTIINLLADFRNFTYTLPQISGLVIYMEGKNTTVTIPVNRYDQVIKSLNNSSDHILAFGGSFSQEADSHLVCIQDTQGNENCYSTHAINIQNKPRKVTGASFIVFNGALKSSSGLTAKSNIVEDGLMIQVLPEHLQQIRDNLRAMKNHTISCGCVNAATDETVSIVWGENDTNFNIGLTSSIDGMSLSGIPSIRVHNGKNHYGANGNRIIRWTEVFIIQNGEDNPKNQDPVDISRISENIAKATCDALLNYLDLLVTNNFQKIGIRTTLHVDSVSYCAGSNNTKLPPIYMKSLDNELIPVLHRITSGNLGENPIILELIFRILNV